MLKALELTGFKSFADRTRFDFPNGITVVVGPNGSGKSNIVDAIKWVLGAQSAKSLRGADMADVIFKGSAVGGRKPANSAEATLVFDNSEAKLPVDAAEVHVTRRVYRSGESEYLINSQPCRLKDIKDLFRGTGVGVDAYSLIEQGKVDRMLQASPKDRRAIFEEAAGISRFKAKKVEAERRLARVDQNLLRLNDIVDEVRTRYESLQNQASKARRYREMQQRLALLRTQMGFADLQGLQDKQRSLLQDRDVITQKGTEQQLELQQAATSLQNIELEFQQLQQTIQAEGDRQSELRANMAALQSTQVALQQRIAEGISERDLLQSRMEALRERADLTANEVERHEQELQSLQSTHQGLQARLQELLEEKEDLEKERSHAQQEVDEQRTAYLRWVSKASDHASQTTARNLLFEQLATSIQSKATHREQLQASLEVAEAELGEAQVRLVECQDVALEKQNAWSESQTRLENLQKQKSELQEDALQLQSSLNAIGERLRVLQELEQQLEGVGQGAKRLIELAQQQSGAPWNTVRGLVADLIEIDMHLAPLIDVALDSAAETIVLNDGQIIQNLREGTLKIEGRVSLIRMDRLAPRRNLDKVQLDGLRGVIGRADRLVRCQEEFQPLVRSLLGHTWLVDSLATALDLSHLRGAGLRFVTAACERIDSDGTLTLGALKSALGLVARRSELQVSREEMLFQQGRVEETRQQLQLLATDIDLQMELVKSLDKQARAAHRELTTAQAFIESRRQQTDHQRQECERISVEHAELLVQKGAVESQLSEGLLDAQQIQDQTAEALAKLESLQGDFQTLEASVRSHNDAVTAQRVLMAKNEQRLESHRATLQQSARDHQERHQAVADASKQIQANQEKLALADLQFLQTTEQLQNAATEMEKVGTQLEVLLQQQVTRQADRTATQKRFEQCQRMVEKNRERTAQIVQEIEQIEGLSQQLVQRFAEDYQIDLHDLQLRENTPPLEDRAAIEAESSKLRQDIAHVGAVNMEALRELDELQTRYEYLAGQQKDLIEARDTLHRIIAKINQDSRRLFLDTLEIIRQNFQVLYRKSFGGGHADIILEEGEDVLECGVEVIATPPGKTSLSNSLLSGGEKALTAVALIMAIFQFRPSPFCVLDEVDAPFDEANIGRFVAVLKDFLDWTKFIVVTHSKKTMTAANTLYGVTMQESGVSTQVSVRFEDVDDEGRILKKAA